MSDGIKHKYGKMRHFGSQSFQAVDGRIWIEDESNGEFRSLSRNEFRDRAAALNEALKRGVGMWNDEKDKLCRAVVDMRDVFFEAKAQGDPSDPKIMAQVAKENRPTKLWVGGDCSSAPRMRPRTSTPTYFLPAFAAGAAILASPEFKQVKI